MFVRVLPFELVVVSGTYWLIVLVLKRIKNSALSNPTRTSNYFVSV